MASLSSWSTALRHTTRRPLSFQLQLSTTTAIRWASIVPYTVHQTSTTSLYNTPPPPPAPMTLEQALEAHQHKQMASLLEEQIKLEQSQRMRFQSELQVELARHRNAILEKQELAALKLRGQLEFEREQKGRRAEEEEEELRRQSLQLAATAAATAVEPIEEVAGVREASVQDQESDNKQLKNSTTTQAPYTTVAASIIDPRYRTMFGYRGPEHSKSTPEELAELEQERRNTLTATLTPSSASSSSVKDTATRIPAENRVLLAMMDYTPSQIEGMTLEQASAILDLRSAQPQEQQVQEQQSSSSLKHTDTTTDTDANTCAQTNGTKTATTAATVVSALVEDISEEEEEEDRRTLRFAPDVMSSVSLHN